MYITYGSVCKTASLTIHCILTQLEKRVQRYGKLPSTIYIQIDGGGENANQWMLALCELLVIMRLTKVVHLTRLPVGHTHEGEINVNCL
jgi:hypothetical protein